MDKISVLALFLIIFFPNVAVLADDTKPAELFYSLSEKDHFGISISQIGDLDNDGIMDIAVGAYTDDDGGQDRGAIYIIFLNDDGTAKSFQKISDTAGGFDGMLHDGDKFGYSISQIGDLDNDGIMDIAVGAYTDDDGGQDRGAVYIIFLNDDGTAKSFQKISDTAGGFDGMLHDGDHFGFSISQIGDLDNDGIMDIAVGAYTDDDGGQDRGAVYIIFLNDDGTAKSFQKISDTAGGFDGMLHDGDTFGHGIPSIGDLDNDGIMDIAVGADDTDDGGQDRGAVYIIFLNDDGTAKSFQKISDTAGGFDGVLHDGDEFGRAISQIGDLDNDGIMDIAVGADSSDDGGQDRGAVYIIFLNDDGTAKSFQKISDTAGGFDGVLHDGDEFGNAISQIGDLDNDGIMDIAVGADDTDDGGQDRGAVYIIFLNDDGTAKSFQKISGEKETSWLQNIEYLIYGIITIAIITGFFIVIRRNRTKSS